MFKYLFISLIWQQFFKEKIMKLFVFSLLFSVLALSAEERTVSSKATVLFKENGVQKYLYSNNHQVILDKKIKKVEKEATTKEDLWLTFEETSKFVVGMGEFIRYSLNIENKGGSTVEESTVSIELPQGFRYIKNSYKVDNITSKK